MTLYDPIFPLPDGPPMSPVVGIKEELMVVPGQTVDGIKVVDPQLALFSTNKYRWPLFKLSMVIAVPASAISLDNLL
jgi:hypothetical protein